MIRTHSYDVTVAWTGNRGSGTSGYREYGRDHEMTVSGAADGDGAGDAGRPTCTPARPPASWSPGTPMRLTAP